MCDNRRSFWSSLMGRSIEVDLQGSDTAGIEHPAKVLSSENRGSRVVAATFGNGRRWYFGICSKSRQQDIAALSELRRRWTGVVVLQARRAAMARNVADVSVSHSCLRPNGYCCRSDTVISVQLRKSGFSADILHHVAKCVYAHWTVFVPALVLGAVVFQVASRILEKGFVFRVERWQIEPQGFVTIGGTVSLVHPSTFFMAWLVLKATRVVFRCFIMGHFGIPLPVLVHFKCEAGGFQLPLSFPSSAAPVQHDMKPDVPHQRQRIGKLENWTGFQLDQVVWHNGFFVLNVFFAFFFSGREFWRSKSCWRLQSLGSSISNHGSAVGCWNGALFHGGMRRAKICCIPHHSCFAPRCKIAVKPRWVR